VSTVELTFLLRERLEDRCRGVLLLGGSVMCLDGIPLAPNRTLEVRRSSQTGGDSFLAHSLQSTPMLRPAMLPGERITRFESRAAGETFACGVAHRGNG
jgi:hypothetical protein